MLADPRAVSDCLFLKNLSLGVWRLKKELWVSASAFDECRAGRTPLRAGLWRSLSRTVV